MTQAPDLDQAHPLRRIVSWLIAETDAAATCSRVGLSTHDKEQVLLGLAELGEKVSALTLSVLAESDDVADQHATRTPGAWLARETRQDPATGGRDSRLARALRDRWHRVAEALAAGDLNLSQVRVIARALDELPADTDPEVLGRAEAKLVELARDLTPAELKRCGWRILEILAPEVVDDREREALERAEARARRQTTLTMRRTAAGMVRITAQVPVLQAELLKTQLHAFMNPRRDHLGQPGQEQSDTDRAGTDRSGVVEGAPRFDPASDERIPYSHLLGEAFCSLLERADLTRLPVHGATAATLLVHLDLDTLRADLRTATLGTGEHSLSPGEVRRLACNAQIIPAVLGGDSELLDVGRSQRLFTPAQRTALEIRHPHCQADGCDIPAPWTEAHHLTPWEHLGPTDLDNGVLLCTYHHHRIHDPAYRHRWRPDGTVRFHRRT